MRLKTAPNQTWKLPLGLYSNTAELFTATLQLVIKRDDVMIGMYLDDAITSNYRLPVWQRLRGAVTWEKPSLHCATQLSIQYSIPSPYITDDTLCSLYTRKTRLYNDFNPLNAELNPICYLLALLGAHHFLHVSRIRVKSLTLRLLSYIYIYIWSTYSWCF